MKDVFDILGINLDGDNNKLQTIERLYELKLIPTFVLKGERLLRPGNVNEFMQELYLKRTLAAENKIKEYFENRKVNLKIKIKNNPPQITGEIELIKSILIQLNKIKLQKIKKFKKGIVIRTEMLSTLDSSMSVFSWFGRLELIFKWQMELVGEEATFLTIKEAKNYLAYLQAINQDLQNRRGLSLAGSSLGGLSISKNS